MVAVTTSDVKRWLRNKKVERNERGKLVLNALQYTAVEKVAERVMEELRQAASGSMDFGEPLRWLVHGGPGTGKSHVIKQIKELFKDVLQWDIGMQYQVVALQAVTANLLGGDTIHHACGIAFQKRGATINGEDQAKKTNGSSEACAAVALVDYR
jgi:hypothetical protein